VVAKSLKAPFDASKGAFKPVLTVLFKPLYIFIQHFSLVRPQDASCRTSPYAANAQRCLDREPLIRIEPLTKN
ncbi:MAG: hypothetical protein ACOZBW_12970, partial [Thermodesulfobacteriota bacterium]